jgi:hypothetical protein
MRLSIILLLTASLHSPVFGQDETGLKVLFVGNSYTYFWNLPQTVSAIADHFQVDLLTRQSTAGGVNLKQHWNGELGLESKKLIAGGNWDIVVLQNHSRSTIDSAEQFFDYGQRFIDYVEEYKARPLLYETWAREYNPLMQEQVSAAYTKLAKRNDIAVVPVGQVWQRLRELRPDLRLFDPDGSHSSTIGTYVTACTFYSFLTGQPAKGIPARVITTDKDGEKLYLAIVSPQDAEFIQSVIDQVLKN